MPLLYLDFPNGPLAAVLRHDSLEVLVPVEREDVPPRVRARRARVDRRRHDDGRSVPPRRPRPRAG